MRDVAIIGVGSTQFGRAQWSLLKMMCEASHEAITDAGIVNGRMFDEKCGVSYHTLTLKRGLRVGAHLFASKMEHHIEYLGQDEVWIVAESPIGHRRWMIEYPLGKKFEVQHELGGAPAWVLTRETYFKAKSRLVTGTRPVSAELLASSYPLREPDLRVMLTQIEHTLEARL